MSRKLPVWELRLVPHAWDPGEGSGEGAVRALRALLVVYRLSLHMLCLQS